MSPYRRFWNSKTENILRLLSTWKVVQKAGKPDGELITSNNISEEYDVEDQKFSAASTYNGKEIFSFTTQQTSATKYLSRAVLKEGGLWAEICQFEK